MTREGPLRIRAAYGRSAPAACRPAKTSADQISTEAMAVRRPRKPGAAAPSAAPDTWRQRGRRGGRRLTARRHAAADTAAEVTLAASAAPDLNVETEYTYMEWKVWGFYTESEQERNAHVDVTPSAWGNARTRPPRRR